MSLQVDDSASEWVFSTPENASLSMQEAGWHQLADDPLAVTDGYFNSTSLWTATPDAAASLVFQGTDIYLYSAKSPQGGQMYITCDWNSTAIPLNQSELQTGEMVWHTTGLDPTVQHVVKVQMVGEGRINIDKVGIDPGPPSAIPPATPDPLPPAFPGVKVVDSESSTPPETTVTSTSVMTMTMTMTASAAPPSTSSSSNISLSGVALAGVVVGPVASLFLIGICFLMCWRRRRRRQRGRNESDIQYTGLRRLRLPRGRGRGSASSHRSGPSFMQIEDQEKAEEIMGEKDVGKAPGGLSAILPSIRRLSTLTLGQSAITSSPTPSRAILAQFPQPPSHRSVSPPHVHHRNRSLALSLSINTDISSVRENIYVGTVRSSQIGSFSRGQTVRSVRTHRHTLSGFSTSDLTEDWQEGDLENETEKDCVESDSALFYAEHFSSQSDHQYTDGRHDAQEGDYVDEPDDISPDTPLLLNSPAVASSNVSLSHHSSAFSHGSRTSKGNKILRSSHSRSTKRSSLRQSLGKLSRRSSMARTPDARTPISKSSHSTSASDSPRDEKRNRMLSTLSVLSMPTLSVDSPGLAQSVPPMPVVPENLRPSSLNGPPSAWNGNLASPPRRAPSQLLLIHRPAGPRARSSSNASTSSKASSTGDSIHSRTSSQNERGEMLSVVEEASGSGSLRTSIDRNRDVEASDLLYD